MFRRFRAAIVLLVLLISLAMSSGCAQAGQTSIAVPALTSAQPTTLPSSAPKQSAPEAESTDIPLISVQDAFNLIQNNKDNPAFMIIDVRTAAEFSSGHLANAVNIDFYSPDFKSEVDKLDRNKEYLVYCQTGIRGAKATQIMIELGFIKVHNLSGGIVQWIDAGYPTFK